MGKNKGKSGEPVLARHVYQAGRPLWLWKGLGWWDGRGQYNNIDFPVLFKINSLKITTDGNTCRKTAEIFG